VPSTPVGKRFLTRYAENVPAAEGASSRGP
jgi:hypothetical protein